MHAVRTIFWDWNGTLVDDAWLACEVINELRLEYALPAISIPFFRSIYQHPIRKMYAEMDFKLTDAEFELLSQRWGRRYVQRFNEVRLHHGAKELVSDFHQFGFYQHVLSAHNHELLLSDVQSHGLHDYFREIVGLENRVADSKVTNGHSLLKRCAVNADSVLLIGDSSHDYEVAEALGCHCILVAQGAESMERLQRHGVEVVENFTDLRRQLDPIELWQGEI